mmetsp:Transcript_64542/g.154178  ORF Transcript_64542/g.154178 Transcript_64542/m.154178 type:complete len:1144 (+) Transcript_64542:53-3484(+)
MVVYQEQIIQASPLHQKRSSFLQKGRLPAAADLEVLLAVAHWALRFQRVVLKSWRQLSEDRQFRRIRGALLTEGWLVPARRSRALSTWTSFTQRQRRGRHILRKHALCVRRHVLREWLRSTQLSIHVRHVGRLRESRDLRLLCAAWSAAARHGARLRRTATCLEARLRVRLLKCVWKGWGHFAEVETTLRRAAMRRGSLLLQLAYSFWYRWSRANCERFQQLRVRSHEEMRKMLLATWSSWTQAVCVLSKERCIQRRAAAAGLRKCFTAWRQVHVVMAVQSRWIWQKEMCFQGLLQKSAWLRWCKTAEELCRIRRRMAWRRVAQEESSLRQALSSWRRWREWSAALRGLARRRAWEAYEASFIAWRRRAVSASTRRSTAVCLQWRLEQSLLRMVIFAWSQVIAASLLAVKQHTWHLWVQLTRREHHSRKLRAGQVQRSLGRSWRAWICTVAAWRRHVESAMTMHTRVLRDTARGLLRAWHSVTATPGLSRRGQATPASDVDDMCQDTRAPVAKEQEATAMWRRSMLRRAWLVLTEGCRVKQATSLMVKAQRDALQRACWSSWQAWVSSSRISSGKAENFAKSLLLRSAFEQFSRWHSVACIAIAAKAKKASAAYNRRLLVDAWQLWHCWRDARNCCIELRHRSLWRVVTLSWRAWMTLLRRNRWIRSMAKAQHTRHRRRCAAYLLMTWSAQTRAANAANAAANLKVHRLQQQLLLKPVWCAWRRDLSMKHGYSTLLRKECTAMLRVNLSAWLQLVQHHRTARRQCEELLQRRLRGLLQVLFQEWCEALLAAARSADGFCELMEQLDGSLVEQACEAAAKVGEESDVSNKVFLMQVVPSPSRGSSDPCWDSNGTFAVASSWWHMSRCCLKQHYAQQSAQRSAETFHCSALARRAVAAWRQHTTEQASQSHKAIVLDAVLTSLSLRDRMTMMSVLLSWRLMAQAQCLQARSCAHHSRSLLQKGFLGFLECLAIPVHSGLNLKSRSRLSIAAAVIEVRDSVFYSWREASRLHKLERTIEATRRKQLASVALWGWWRWMGLQATARELKRRIVARRAQHSLNLWLEAWQRHCAEADDPSDLLLAIVLLWRQVVHTQRKRSQQMRRFRRGCERSSLLAAAVATRVLIGALSQWRSRCSLIGDPHSVPL